MKKIIILLMVCMALCAAVFAQNQSGFKTDGKGTITGYDGWDTKIVIPAQINGVPVTAVGDNAFKNMGLTSVTFPTSIKYIGKAAFISNKITNVTIPANVTIDEDAFSSNQMTGFTVGNGCIIARSAFTRNNLKNLVLGANIRFEADAFSFFLYYEYMCNGKKAGTYDVTVNYIPKKDGDYEFIETKYGAVIILYTGSDVNRLQIPQKLGGAAVKGIMGKVGGRYLGAFANRDITRMQLPDGLLFIGYSSFANNKLSSVTIPNSVTTIDNYAFFGNNLTSITIPNIRKTARFT